MSTRSIYVVERDESYRLMLQAQFARLPNTLVWGFASGAAFLDRTREMSPGCIVLDYDLPDFSGVEMLNGLVPLSDRFAVIVLTGRGTVPLAIEAMKAGARDLLEKPCDVPVLISAVEAALSAIEARSSLSARAREAARRIAALSPRELDVLNGLLNGESNKVIAQNLGISPRTVEIHRANLGGKLGARNLSEIVKIAVRAGGPPLESDGLGVAFRPPGAGSASPDLQ